MDENGRGQSGCKIFNLTISLEKKYEKAWFFISWYKFIEIKSWLESTGVGVAKNGCVHSGHMTLKLAVSQEEIIGRNSFLVC